MFLVISLRLRSSFEEENQFCYLRLFHFDFGATPNGRYIDYFVQEASFAIDTPFVHTFQMDCVQW